MRIGVVGTGWWAENVHLPACAVSEEVTLVGVYGRRTRHTREVAERHNCRPFDSFESLLSHVDAVDFAVPPETQAPLAVAAALAGKHLMLEKPVATTSREAAKILAAVTSGRVASMVFLTRQFDPAIASWVAETRRYSWHGAHAQLLTSAMTEEGMPWSQSQWRIAKGGLWDIGPHALATMLPILGAVTHTRALRGSDGLIQAVLAHATGALSTLATTIAAPPPTLIDEFSVWGEHGVSSQPSSSIEPVEAFVTALHELAKLARGEAGATSNLGLAADIVSVLESVERALTD